MKKLHCDLVKWVVRLLLSMTSTDLQEFGEGVARGEDHSHIRHIESTANLKADFSILAQQLANFTKQLQT